MKTKIFFTAAVATALLMSTSCKNEVEDIFDDSAANRIENALVEYSDVLTQEVRRQMEARMAADSGASYFPEELTEIGPEQNFYFNESGELVLVLDEYTIAPGSMGMPEFTIPAEVYETLRK